MKYPAIAIVGSGPASSALALYLMRAGIKVGIFTDGKSPELIVGESLIPAVIPFLRDFNLEQKVAACGTYKPGTTFYLRPDDGVSFFFQHGKHGLPTYAYNVPRKNFDSILQDEALARGVKLLARKAELLTGYDGDSLELDRDSRDLFISTMGMPPAFIIDATGINRSSAEFHSTPAKEGSRGDTALFAHVSQADIQHEGHIHVDRLVKGWSWRIPLPGRVSVGIVAPLEYLSSFGSNSIEQYDGILKEEPILRQHTKGAARLSAVMKYSNYQLVSTRFVGTNWASMGDAAGLMDPIFSSGLLLALTGAKELSKYLTGETSSLKKYQTTMHRKHFAWKRMLEYFYRGELFALIRFGRGIKGVFPWCYTVPHFERQINRILTGLAPDSTYSQTLLSLFVKHATKGKQKPVLRVQ